MWSGVVEEDYVWEMEIVAAMLATQVCHWAFISYNG